MRLPIIAAIVFEVTVFVLTVKVTEVFPAGILTDAGTTADPLLEDSEICSPPAGAAELMDTVPVLVLPPLTDAGLKVTDISNGAIRVNVVVPDTPLRLAFKVAAV